MKAWLETQNWLVLFDDADTYQGISDDIPARGGHIIITTRTQLHWPIEFTVLHV